MLKIAVIGGGAAGMLAAIAASGKGCDVTLFEKNEKLGKKIYITGKGRCNLTNAASMEDSMANVVSNPRFLYSAFAAFTNQDICRLVEENGCPVKEERGQRMFPTSDKSSDVIAALTKELKKQRVQVRLRTSVLEILTEDGRASGVLLSNGKREAFDRVILATGGLSYPSTGATGDGHRMADTLGMKVTDCRPALVPLVMEEPYAATLEGLSLRNIEVHIADGKKELYSAFGELVFTADGMSGPVILSASSRIGARLEKKKALKLTIDLKPALSPEQLDARILRDFEKEQNKAFSNSLGGLYPARLAALIVQLSGIDPMKKVNNITKAERQTLVRLTKELPFTVIGTHDFREAIITQGGISVKEVNPSTMEAKQLPGLYIAGEVLDLDALTGGFNLQIAWSTGYLAGQSAKEEQNGI